VTEEGGEKLEADTLKKFFEVSKKKLKVFKIVKKIHAKKFCKKCERCPPSKNYIHHHGNAPG